MNDPPLSATDLHPGSTLGRYELLLPIAKGGMAQVWAARLRGSRGFQKLVAIKTILAGVIDNTRMEQMFLEEAQLASQIHHPNVVGTLELGEENSALYLVMEWVDGESLSVVLSKAAASGGVPLPIAVNLIGQACQGLYAAHNLRDESGALLGLVHRDVSPQNLLVTFSGTAKLVDFGIAKATSKVSGLTEAGEIKGKFAYMAPEQVRGLAIDARTDLFALGILLYLLTTGKHPFRGEHPGATVQNICAAHGPTPPSAFLPDYPAALEQVVLKALAKEPDQRFATANEMLTALETAMPGPLEASFEVQVADYLKRLFGARATERRAAIRLAQEHADRQRAESSSSISVGTLRAISVDPRSVSSLPVPAASQTLTSGVDLELPEPRRLKPRAGTVAALLVTLLAVGGGILQLTRGDGHEDRTAASSPVPAESLYRPAEPAAAASGGPASSASAVAVTQLPELADSDEDSPKSKSKRDRKGARAPVAARLAPVSAPLPTTTAAPPPVAPSSPAPAPTPATAASSNAWDRGAFGGRH
jgi:eukaryotic-like serine/threonine-protein kinase